MNRPAAAAVTGDVSFTVLGGVEARFAGRPVDLGHARQRVVLAALLVDAGRPVPAARLVDRVWGRKPPQRAQATLYSYVSRLRRALAEVGGPDIVRRRDGYVLSVPPEAVDLHRFGQLVGQARATRDDRAADLLFREALALWRSEPFGALDNDWLRALREDLRDRRLAAELDHAAVQRRLGPALAAVHRIPDVPRQLPAPPARFVGRRAELAALDRGTEVPVWVVHGARGVGKTWLALRWANGHTASFPDGQLHADLRGRGPDDVLRGFLTALCVPAGRLPADLDALAALYRSTLAGRRVLVVLDNAPDADQVRPLLPGSPGCVVVVISRSRLNGLVTADGARALALEAPRRANALPQRLAS